MTREGYKPGDLSSGDLMGLYASAVAGGEYLSLELERLGLSDEEDAVLDAMRLRPALLEGVESATRRSRIEERAPAIVSRLRAAATAGEQELAGELEHVGLAKDTDALQVARRVRARLLEVYGKENDEKEDGS